jgi:hypothetical protein
MIKWETARQEGWASGPITDPPQRKAELEGRQAIAKAAGHIPGLSLLAEA